MTAKRKREPDGTKDKKVHVGLYIWPALMEEVRNAVVIIPSLTVSNFFENAANAELKRLKKKHNDGQDFPKRKTNPRQGRPVR